MKLLLRGILLFLLYIIPLSAQYSWELKQFGSSLGNPIVVQHDNSDIVYYGASATVYKSWNRGESFTAYGTSIPGANKIKNIILSRKDTATCLVAFDAGIDKIVKTTNNGQTWRIVADNLSFSYFGIPTTPDPQHPDTIYTMSNSNFMRSTDFGETWITLATVAGFGTPCDIEVMPDSSEVILIGDNGTGIFKSTDAGFTWTQVFNTTGEIPTIATDKINNGVVWATRWGGGGGFLKSIDYGTTWTPITFFNGQNMWGVDVNPFDSDFIITGKYSGGSIYISKDGGNSWLNTSIGGSNYAVYIVDSMTVFAAQSTGFYKLTSPWFIPVELTSFNALVNDNIVKLLWETSTETNNYGFEIEKSFDAEYFFQVGFVSGYGTSTEKHSYSFYETISSKTYYRLKQIDYNGAFKYSSIDEAEPFLPSDYKLNQNYPNPFNPSTTISFELPEEAMYSIKIFSMLGEELNLLSNGKLQAGKHEINFSASSVNGGLPSGNYIVSLQASGVNGKVFHKTIKISLIK